MKKAFVAVVAAAQPASGAGGGRTGSGSPCGRSDVDEIRRKYPNPSSARRPQGPYCVGGAFLLSSRWRKTVSYPDATTLALKLRAGNDNLSREEADHCAAQIIRENDAGNFEDAWAWLDKALSFRDESP
jgi:hypothetical protein